ncbi:FAD-dependent oxidoreductase [Rhodococcus pseudokoreensis]|uniref:FAD-dependent oxidoreductase n=1 Tax=Rhodococcus pseudokoreensis TaxID=2811421 RepID=A0A974WB93_9NOCA|nr:FAD-dependent oxidoreductase [Rhodococcus pseudokoreensis]QSE93603.1 FAD-dependent oxidoreductase [Rhodococcus pseudokoreensis]
MKHIDVVVIGAGPTGCMLAAELATAGRSVTVLDKRAAPSTLSRAFGVHARTLELLDARGLADRLVATGAPSPGLKLWRGAALNLGRLRSRFPYVLVTPQQNVDALLEAHARERGADFVRGFTVTGVEQDGDGVRVHGHDGSGRAGTFHAAYAVGADGAHSVVRTLIGQPFPGKAVLRSIMLADVELEDPPDNLVTVNAVRDGFAFIAPYGDNLFRVIAWNRGHQVDDSAPVDREELRSTIRIAMGTDYGLGDVRWQSRFHSDERQVPQYRTGRVFLAGDAAHVHSPAGGQGMNTGIQDAMNLGWKLAAVLGGADDAVLDTYHSERHPVGRMVLRSSGATMRMMTVRPWILRKLRNGTVAAFLGFPPVGDAVARMFSGIGIGYGHDAGESALVGRRAEDLPTDAGRLYEVLRSGGFVLVTEPGAPVPDGIHAVARTADGLALLVRPDGYVAWAGDSRSGLWRGALDRWTARTAVGAGPVSP